MLLGAVPAEIGQVAVDVSQGDGTDKMDVHIQNRNFIQVLAAQRRVSGLFHIAEKIPEIKKVFVNSFLRMRFDGLVVCQEIN